MTLWNDDAREEVFRLWREGLSASQIARRIPGGYSRNAIIGVVHRGGLTRTRATASAPQRVREGLALPNRAPAVKRDRTQTNGVQQRVAAKKREPKQPAGVFVWAEKPRSDCGPPRGSAKVDAFAPLPGQEPVTLLARAWNQCAWPVGGDLADILFCGADVPEGPGLTFCPAHRQRARNKHIRSRGPDEMERLAGPRAA